MNKKINNILFFCVSLLLIFNDVSKIFQINLISGLLQTKLVFYPVFIGLIYTLYCQFKYKNVFLILINF